MKPTNVISFFGVRSALREGKPLSDAVRVGKQIASEMISDGMMKPVPFGKAPKAPRKRRMRVPLQETPSVGGFTDLVADAFDADVEESIRILDRAIKNAEKEI